MTDWKSKWTSAYSTKWEEPYWYNEERITTWFNPHNYKSEKEYYKDIEQYNTQPRKRKVRKETTQLKTPPQSMLSEERSAETAQRAQHAAQAKAAAQAQAAAQHAESVVIVPGYGMAVAQAQAAVKELTNTLKNKNIEVKFAIHPVAGRMPGHMNVLLAEVDIDYEDMYTLEDINSEFSSTDVVLVLGANDVVNPLARTDEDSPIYGMPILDVDLAKQVIVIKRSMSPGYAGIANPLFINENAKMLFADAKEGLENIIKSFELV